MTFPEIALAALWVVYILSTGLSTGLLLRALNRIEALETRPDVRDTRIAKLEADHDDLLMRFQKLSGRVGRARLPGAEAAGNGVDRELQAMLELQQQSAGGST